MNYKILIIILLFSQITQPFVSYYLLKRDGKYILILGDRHSKAITAINEYHTEIFIHSIELHTLKKPIPFIMESGFNDNSPPVSESVSQKIDDNHSRDITARSLYEYFSKHKTILDLIYYDIRESITFILSLILEELDTFIAHNNASDLFDFEAFKEAIPYSTEDTLKQYITYLDTSYANIQNWLKNSDPNTLEYKEIYELSEQFFKRREVIINLLCGTQPEDNLDAFVINTFKECKTIEEVNIASSRVLDYMFNTDVYLADIGFLQKLIAVQSNHPKALFVTGHSHATNTAESLQRIGYTLISCKHSKPHEDFINNIRHIMLIFLMSKSVGQQQ